MKYCPDVWKGLYVKKISDEQVSIGFCCINENVRLDNVDNLASFVLKKQQDFVHAMDSSQCKNCWELENTNNQSRRTGSIQWFKNNNIELTQTNELLSLDWNSENICNLACISCGPVFSSKWREEIKQYSSNESVKYYNSQKNKFWKTLDLSKLRRIYFNGGEPLLSKDHVEILSHLKDINQLKHVEVCYNTNGTVLPDKKIIDLWRQSKLLRIYISIDAIGPAFEFIRWPAQWGQVEKFISEINKLDFNVILNITCTTGIYNVLELDDIIEWHGKHLKTNSQGDPVSLNIQPMADISYGSNCLKFENTSKNTAQQIISQCGRIKQHSSWQWIYPKLISAQGNNDWVFYLDQLDHHRKTNWRNTLKLSTTV